MEKKLNDTLNQYKNPEDLVQELLDLDDISQARIWKAIRMYGFYSDSAEDLYQDAMVRILENRRKCPLDLDVSIFFIGVVRSITSEIYEKTKKSIKNEDILPLDITFWGNQHPQTPDTILMKRRNESEFLPDGFINNMISDVEDKNDDGVKQYVIYSLIYGLLHEDIVVLFNWSNKEAQAIQKRASRLKNKHIVRFKLNRNGD